MVAKAFLSLARARIGYFSVVQMTRSSAKRALDTLRRSGKSLIKIRNNIYILKLADLLGLHFHTGLLVPT